METVRWGLIGCGDISRKRVAPALRDAPRSELHAVARAQAELAEEFAREFGAPRHYADWRNLIADPEIDAVYVATPVDLHASQTIAAAQVGKHVLCEKPMALTTNDCDRAAATCAEAGVKLGIAYYRRFYPVLRRIKEIIASGEVGQPVMAHINAFETFNPAPGEPRHWLIEKARSGGGPMMDFGCHRIEVLMNLLGPIDRTQAFTGQVRLKRDVEDTAGAFFHFEGGAHATLLVSHAAFESQDTLDVFCSEGSLHVPVLNKGELRIVTRAGERTESHPPHPNLHQPLVEDFVAAVIDDHEPAVGPATGREVQRIEELIYSQSSWRCVAPPRRTLVKFGRLIRFRRPAFAASQNRPEGLPGSRSVIAMLRFLLDSLRDLASRRLPPHLRSARRGEDIAYRHLKALGYRIVARNYRSRTTKGETDLIGWDGDYLAFIEVKTRAGETFGRPEDAVDGAKRNHLVRAAKDYVRRAGVDHNRMRFDIVSVILGGDEPEVRLLKGAFVDSDTRRPRGRFR